jgi:hypothetical protein
MVRIYSGVPRNLFPYSNDAMTTAGVTCSHRSIEQEIALAGNYAKKMGLTCKVAALELGMKREEGNRQIYYCLTQKKSAIS